MKYKYLTWLDIRRVIRRKTHYGKQLPNGIVRIGCFSDALEIGITDEKQKQVAWEYLEQWFGDWYEKDTQSIKLDIEDAEIPVEFCIEESSNQISDRKIRPFWEEISYLKDENKEHTQEESLFFNLPEIAKDINLKLIAFYSFKGGVGRTLSLVAHILALVEQAKKNNQSINILIIDADLEAPGITYWERLEQKNTTVSFIDFLEVYHSSPIEIDKSLTFIAKEIKKSVRQEGQSKIYVLPACLNDEELLDTPILPEHLVRNIDGVWEFSQAIFILGKYLEVDYIFLDLRSGLSEISSPILFDPRVQRFLVTTINEQSVGGTSLVLEQLSYIAPAEETIRNNDYYDPILLINFLTPELKKIPDFEDALSKFQSSYIQSNNQGDYATRLEIKETDFAQQLLYINSWEDARLKLAGSTVMKVAQEWAENQLTLVENNIFNNSNLTKIQQVEKLRDICQKYEYAESGEGEDLLITESLKNLAITFQDDLPRVVSIGAKGSGKTFNYIQLSRLKYWHKFIEKVTQESTELNNNNNNIYIYPLLQSSNLKDKAIQITKQAREQVKQALGDESVSFSSSELVDRIKKTLRNTDWGTPEWTEFWLKEIARSIGYKVQNEDSYSIGNIDKFLKNKSSKVIFLFDGLEDVFNNIFDDRSQKIAIESLIRIPQRIAEIRSPNFGIIIFIRRDYINHVIDQNLLQFKNLYHAYNLFWDINSFLRLVYWIFCKTGIPNFKESELKSLSNETLNKKLEKMWGRKLGLNNASEAYTTEWIFAALTDFKGQLQARDIVRFLYHVTDKIIQSRDKVEFEYWSNLNNSNNRLLPPKAIRCAIEPCSHKKIEEAQEEYPKFKEWFNALPTDKQFLKIPITNDNLNKLNIDKSTLNMLEEMGVFYEYNNKNNISCYYIPEIFRYGLGFILDGGARPNVLTLKRQALGNKLF